MDNVLSIKNLKKIYHTKEGETKAVEDFSFDLKEGDFVGIVGPSGCGKSTILSVLCGLEEKSGGDIKLMGVIGLYVGFFNNIQVFILSFFIAAIISIALLASKKKNSDDYIPFGPFIVLAAYLTMLFPASVTMPIVLQLIG